MKFWGYSSPNSAFCQQNSPRCYSAHMLELFTIDSLSLKRQRSFSEEVTTMNSKGGYFKSEECIKSCNWKKIFSFKSQARLKEEELSPAEKQFSGWSQGLLLFLSEKGTKNLIPSVRTRTYFQEGDCKLGNRRKDLTLLTGTSSAPG